MRTKMRFLIPVLICLTILVSVAGGFWYWYDNNVDRSGWKEDDGIRYYRDFHAKPVTGWLQLDEGIYYFEEGGIPHIGWLTREGATYYFDDRGVMATGWQKLKGNTHYFGADGVMADGWLQLEQRYYLREGVLVTGWQSIDGERYHFGEDGTMTLGFAQIGTATYYFGTDGIMTCGMTELEGNVYNFQDSGEMFVGWQELEAGKRYFREDGTMAKGWIEVDGSRLYFDENGIQQHTGWLTDGEYRYYILEDGSYAVGPTVIDGQTHYFTPKGIEVILVNGTNPVPDYYQTDLVNVIDYHDVDRRCFDALIFMLADLTDAGIEYTFNSAYRTLNEQITILEYRTLEHMRDYKLDFHAARDKALDTVAVPGTSEHHLGLAVDLLGNDAIAWLTEHCWEYGFIVRYTEEKESITGIIDEPWHFRYVGKEVSMDMKDTGLCLEEYLGAEPVTPEGIQQVHGDRWYREEFTMLNQQTIDQYIGTDKEQS